MVEKVIELGEISLVDFLGVENINIKELVSAFPKSKIISRGDEIRIQGVPSEVMEINSVFNKLLVHYQKYRKITPETINEYLKIDKTVSDLEAQLENAPSSGDEPLLYGNRGVPIKPKSLNQKKLVEASSKDDLVFAVGPAGTGKTYIAVALAVKALKNKEVKKIIITRPAVEAGESLGFLPGDLTEKLDPYLRPVYDALHDLIPAEKLTFYLEKNIIEIAPLAYMRGRTLHNAFILLDEAQNTTGMQMKMFLTRMGPESKMIITGDVSQIDLPTKQKSGLVEALEILKGTRGISIIRLSEKDVVRHRLVKKIISAYKENH